MSFETALQKVLIHEGGYKLTQIEGDRGGMTYAGIARASFPHWEGWSAVDSGGQPTQDQVAQIYKDNFWDKLRCEELPEAVADEVFDCSVNTGVGTAAKLLQASIGAQVDGSIGPATIEALKGLNPDDVLIRFKLAWIARYVAIVGRDRSQEKFLLGWLRRALS